MYLHLDNEDNISDKKLGEIIQFFKSPQYYKNFENKKPNDYHNQELESMLMEYDPINKLKGPLVLFSSKKIGRYSTVILLSLVPIEPGFKGTIWNLDNHYSSIYDLNSDKLLDPNDTDSAVDNINDLKSNNGVLNININSYSISLETIDENGEEQEVTKVDIYKFIPHDWSIGTGNTLNQLYNNMDRESHLKWVIIW